MLTRKNFILSVTGSLNLYSRYNFYTKDEKAEFLGSCTLPSGNWKGVATVAGKKIDFKVLPDLRVQIPLKGFTPGKYQVHFEISGEGGGRVSSVAEMSVLPERKAPYCRIDRKNRALEINGKPALTVAPFLGVEQRFTPEMARNLVRTFADAGFKYLTCGSHEPDNAATRAFMNEAEKRGIKVVYWNFYAWRMRGKWKPEEFAAKVRQYPNVVALLIIDEPELYAKSDDSGSLPQAVAHLASRGHSGIFSVCSEYCDWQPILEEECRKRHLHLKGRTTVPDLNARREILHEICREAPPAILSYGWQTTVQLLRLIESDYPDYKPDIVTNYHFHHPLFSDPRIAGVIWNDLPNLVRKSVALLLGKVEGGAGNSLELPTRFFPAGKLPPDKTEFFC